MSKARFDHESEFAFKTLLVNHECEFEFKFFVGVHGFDSSTSNAGGLALSAS